jgi:hypothetical protein
MSQLLEDNLERVVAAGNANEQTGPIVTIGGNFFNFAATQFQFLYNITRAYQKPRKPIVPTNAPT